MRVKISLTWCNVLIVSFTIIVVFVVDVSDADQVALFDSILNQFVHGSKAMGGIKAVDGNPSILVLSTASSGVQPSPDEIASIQKRVNGIVASRGLASHVQGSSNTGDGLLEGVKWLSSQVGADLSPIG